ncbi:hypothetical protein [Nocardia sp. NPDC051570]|uniref:hypothetical protein n=1 Tax=Nocardia sp. NPDC051570 TaxID=3364324 RepID=UPI0037B78A59
MGEMDADLPTLDWLAGVLATHAETIGKLQVTGQVTMPDSPIQALSAQVGTAAAQAFGLIGANYRSLSDATKTIRKSYADLDAAFAAQLRRYADGSGPR